MSETRSFGEKLIKKRDSHYFFHSSPTKGFRGAGFYINKKGTSKITEIKSISDRISILKIKLEKNTKLLIIQVYAPTLQADINET